MWNYARTGSRRSVTRRADLFVHPHGPAFRRRGCRREWRSPETSVVQTSDEGRGLRRARRSPRRRRRSPSRRPQEPRHAAPAASSEWQLAIRSAPGSPALTVGHESQLLRCPRPSVPITTKRRCRGPGLLQREPKRLRQQESMERCARQGRPR